MRFVRQVAFIVLFASISLFLLSSMPKPLAELFTDEQIGIVAELYCNDCTFFTTQENWDSDSYEIIRNGDCFILRCDVSYCDVLKSKVACFGESVSLFGGETEIAELLNDLQVRTVFTEQTENGYCLYGYSRLISGSVTIEGKRINVQLAYSNGKITLGSPVIYGGF